MKNALYALLAAAAVLAAGCTVEDEPDSTIVTPPADSPDVNVTTPPADAPDVNVTTPPASTTTTTTGGGG